MGQTSLALSLVVPLERRILLLRGYKVMMNLDLTEVYGVSTKRLNEQVRRNMLKFSSVLPYAFTEHGALTVRLRACCRIIGSWPKSWRPWKRSMTRSSRSCLTRPPGSRLCTAYDERYSCRR